MAKRKKIAAPEGMDPAPEIQGNAREQLALWMKDRMREIAEENRDRIELLRTVGEHPSPIFQNIVQQHGALGMPKRLVARLLGITVGTLDKFYGEAYDLGDLSAIRAVAANAMRIGSSPIDPNAGRVAMQILDRRGGDSWVPPAQKIITEDDRSKAPIIDSSKLSYEERQQLRVMLERIANGGEGEPLTEDEMPKPGMDLIE